MVSEEIDAVRALQRLQAQATYVQAADAAEAVRRIIDADDVWDLMSAADRRTVYDALRVLRSVREDMLALTYPRRSDERDTPRG